MAQGQAAPTNEYERLIENSRLTQEYWNACMTEVENVVYASDPQGAKAFRTSEVQSVWQIAKAQNEQAASVQEDYNEQVNAALDRENERLDREIQRQEEERIRERFHHHDVPFYP